MRYYSYHNLTLCAKTSVAQTFNWVSAKISRNAVLPGGSSQKTGKTPAHFNIVLGHTIDAKSQKGGLYTNALLVCPRKLLPQHELKSACKIDLRIQLRKTCSSRHLISLILGLVWVHSQHKLVRRSFSSYFIQFTHYKPLTLDTIQFEINYDFHGYQQQLRN